MPIRLLYKGPTDCSHCEKCKGGQPHPLKLGVGYHFIDTGTGKRFVTGPTCRLKFDQRPESAIPTLAVAGLHLENEGRASNGGARGPFGHATVDYPDALPSETLDAFVCLSLRRALYDRGFEGMYDQRLKICKAIVFPEDMDRTQIEAIQTVQAEYEKRSYLYSTENLRKVLHTAMQIEDVMAHSRSEQQKGMMQGFMNHLQKHLMLTDRQLDSLRAGRAMTRLPRDLSFERVITPGLDLAPA